MKKSLILTIVLFFTLMFSVACTKKEAVQTTTTLGGVAAGYFLGGSSTAGKVIGALVGAGVGYFVGDYIGDYLTSEEQAALDQNIRKNLAQLDEEQTGTSAWQSERHPERKVDLQYSEGVRLVETIETGQSEILNTTTMCREVSITPYDTVDGRPIGEQKQLYCRDEMGDYVAEGEPYIVQTAEK